MKTAILLLLLVWGVLILCSPAAHGQFEYGFTGHASSNVAGGPTQEEFKHGLSFYSAVHPLNNPQNVLTQLGWATWLSPDNQGFTQPLCPVGTNARDNWPERGPTWDGVYQTIEGGIGQWGTTHFPSAVPKWRIASTPDCYTSGMGTPGYASGGEHTETNRLGLAQLSNRLLLAPDGISFINVSDPSLFGYGWITLPLIPAYTSPIGVPTGDQSWTVFFHAANFKGPVAFMTPEIWSAVNATDPTGIGRGFDARPNAIGDIAIEIGGTPFYTEMDSTGTRYARIPRLTFPTGPSGKAVMIQDVRFYSKDAIWNDVAQWVENGTVATQFNSSGFLSASVENSVMGLRFNDFPITYDGLFKIGAVQIGGNQTAFGMEWSGELEPGVIPEYYRLDGNTWRPVPPNLVPQSTHLANKTFPEAHFESLKDLDLSSQSPWTPAKWSAGPFTTVLSDSSVVEYVWYKFIDQPAITRLGLSQSVLQKLQAFVESLHENSGLNGITIPPPSSENLVTIDPALFVEPPSGLEKGYVPIAVKHYRPVTISVQEMAVLQELYTATNGAGWKNSSNWFTGTIDTWHGVKVGNNKVVEIKLGDNGLTGILPASLANLSNLEVLDLGYNQLSGELPSWLGNLTNLTSLSLSSNAFTGSIPAELGNLAKLRFLNLSSNQLSDDIPESLANLISLEDLDLSGNMLSGPFPSWVVNLPELHVLELSGNPSSSGVLPQELGNLTNLVHMGLAGIGLTGSIPPTLGNLTNLTLLQLAGNQLSGEIPATLGNLTNLQWLFLSDNKLSGSLPAELGALTNLAELWLSNNPLQGPLPLSLQNLQNLKILQYFQTQLCAPQDSAFQLWLQGLAALSTSGLTCMVTSTGDIYTAPQMFSMYQNYPNPFNPSTKIQFGLPSRSFVSLKIFNTLGQEIEALINGEYEAGTYSIDWQANDLPAGVYYYRLQTGQYVETKKMILLK